MNQNGPFKVALITGISGSGGSYMADYISRTHPNIELHGVTRWHTNTKTNLVAEGKAAELHECDLNDYGAIFRVLEKVRPDVVFHLASHANVRACFDTPVAVVQNNINCTLNLFDAVRTLNLDPIIQMCSTSEVYGQVAKKNVPISEDCPLNPVSPYAVSKTAQDLLAYSYFKSFGIRIIRTRMFAYLNPRRSDLFATSFALQVAKIERGLQHTLVHGNLNSTRTIVDVRDAMAAYWAAAEHCLPGDVYNIGGPTVIKVGEFLETLRSLATCPISCEEDPALFRPVDVTLQVPDISKFQAATGWRPSYSFEESIEHLLSECREAVARNFP